MREIEKQSYFGLNDANDSPLKDAVVLQQIGAAAVVVVVTMNSGIQNEKTEIYGFLVLFLFLSSLEYQNDKVL
jgi:hypothetical protein